MDGRRETAPLTVEDAATEELARRVVRQVAPAEEEIFDVVRDAYLRDPHRSTGRGDGRDRMLGFGIEAAATLLTPLVLGISAEVIRHLTLEAVGAIEVRARLRRLLDRRRGHPADSPAGTAETGPETLEQSGTTTPPRPEVAAGPPTPAPRGDGTPAAPTVDPRRIRELVVTRCRQAGIEEERAHLIADAVVGALHTDG